MRGTDTNPNLLRSQDALIDQHGEILVPILRGESADFPGHKTDIGVDDAEAVAAYIRSLLAEIGSQGRAPGDASNQPNILVGDAERGQQYFAKTCASCHSATGDLSGLAKKVSNPKLPQAAWLRGTYLGANTPPATVTVTEPGMPAVSGIHAVHLRFSGAQVSPTQAVPNPPIRPRNTSVEGGQVMVIAVENLIIMKLSSFRLKDQVHIKAFDAAGLILPSLEKELTSQLAERLRYIRDID